MNDYDFDPNKKNQENEKSEPAFYSSETDMIWDNIEDMPKAEEGIPSPSADAVEKPAADAVPESIPPQAAPAYGVPDTLFGAQPERTAPEKSEVPPAQGSQAPSEPVAAAPVSNDNAFGFNNFYQPVNEQPKQAYSSPQQSQQSQSPQDPQQTYQSYQGYTPQQSGQGYQQSYRPNQPYSPYRSQQYQTSYQEPSDGGSGGVGKKIAFGVIIVCLIIAIGVIAKSILSGALPLAQTTTGNILGDPTSHAGAPQVTIGSTQSGIVEDIDGSNSIWVADKVRPSIVGVMTYIDGMLAGEGSGVIWGKDSTGTYTYIVTCAHVVDEDDSTFGILLLDGRSFEAELIATDARTDIGVLRVEATDLPVAELGDSSVLKIGEPIYAIGNPGGSEYFGSITDGIVSAIDRSITASYTMTCIQHNAAINPGNSGGALVNTAGQIVGINSSKIASTEFEGMGFAVPVSIVKPVVDSLIQYGYVPNRPKLGIKYAQVSEYQLYSIVVSVRGLPKGSLVIAEISPDSSFAGKGVQAGDLIIGVNGVDMDDPSVLLDLIDTGAVGDTLTLTLCRIEGRTYKVTTYDVTITLVEDKGDYKG